MGKTLLQLKKELAKEKARGKKTSMKLKKAKNEAMEIRKVKAELAQLKRSPFLKKVRRLRKNGLTDKEKKTILDTGKKASKIAKKGWAGLGKIVNRLDKLGN